MWIKKYTRLYSIWPSLSDFFHLAKGPEILFILLQMVEFPFLWMNNVFLWMNNVIYMYISDFFFSFFVCTVWHQRRQWHPTPHSCLENPMDGGAWWAVVHGVAKSRTRLSDFPFTFHFPALKKEMATQSSVLAWRIPGTVEPGGLPSMGSHRVGHYWSDLAADLAAAAAVCHIGS